MFLYAVALFSFRQVECAKIFKLSCFVPGYNPDPLLSLDVAKIHGLPYPERCRRAIQPQLFRFGQAFIVNECSLFIPVNQKKVKNRNKQNAKDFFPSSKP